MNIFKKFTCQSKTHVISYLNIDFALQGFNIIKILNLLYQNKLFIQKLNNIAISKIQDLSQLRLLLEKHYLFTCFECLFYI